MNSRVISISLSIFFLTGYIVFFSPYESSRKAIKMEEVKGLTLPPAIVKLLSLEYRAIASDLLFIRVSQFYGGKVVNRVAATQDDWNWLYRNLDLATELDPYFQDPYFLGNAFLTWDAGMYVEAENLLTKAIDARPWDWNFPFFMGFNKFFFMGDNKGGADYFLMAYERPGAWSLLPALAARLYHEGKKTETAISFLERILEKENDARIKRSYEMRLDALYKILFLEKAVSFYEDKVGVPLVSLQALIDNKILKEIPPDPYGGKFYIDKDGNIKTTSKLAVKPKRKGN